jgi:hypothetical protein
MELSEKITEIEQKLKPHIKILAQSYIEYIEESSLTDEDIWKYNEEVRNFCICAKTILHIT